VSVVVATDGTREYVARGECRGRILDAAEGTNGFGYDPFFFSDDLGESFGSASREEKSAVSHRGRAFRALGRATRRLATVAKPVVARRCFGRERVPIRAPGRARR
jgi:non-canonical purine NTP pyrophosphatase (RdgB/HAM1 family)